MEWIRHLNDSAVLSLQQSNSIECKTFLTDALERLNGFREQEESSLEDLDPSLLISSAEANTKQETSSGASVVITNKHHDSSVGVIIANITTESRVAVRSIPGSLPTLPEEDHEDESSSSAQWAQDYDLRFMEAEAFPLYSRPFLFDFALHFRQTRIRGAGEVIPPNETILLPLSQRTLCSALCLYNLALAHCLEYRSYRTGQRHNSRVTDPVKETPEREPGDHLLERALALYEIAYSLLVQLSTVRLGDSTMILVMAVCNNVASVHQTLGNLEASTEWKQQLSCALSCCQYATLDQVSLEFFYFTAHILPDFNAATAA